MSTGTSKYTPEFRQEAVRMVLEEGQRQTDVAKRLGITESSINNWVYNERRRRREAGLIPGSTSVTSTTGFQPSLEDYRKLERENRRLQQERDILKKAMAYFVELPK